MALAHRFVKFPWYAMDLSCDFFAESGGGPFTTIHAQVYISLHE